MTIELLGPEPQDDALNSRDFYEVCQAYRYSPLGALEFEALKTWIRQNAAVNSTVTNPLYPTVTDPIYPGE